MSNVIINILGLGIIVFRPKKTVARPGQQNQKECLMFRRFLFAVVACVSVVAFVGCSDSVVASVNISRAAHQFEIFRRVVFYNGITNDYILEVRAFCSVVPEDDGRLSVTIKTEDGQFLKHYLGLSDNVTYFCEQLKPSSVSDKNYRVIFKPSVIVPYVDVE